MSDKYVIKNGSIIEGFLSGATLLDIQGVNGQVFSITDNLVGDIFRVSDITGIPILNVNSDSNVTVDGSLKIGNSITNGYDLVINNDLSSIRLEPNNGLSYFVEFINDFSTTNFDIKYNTNKVLSSLEGLYTTLNGKNMLYLSINENNIIHIDLLSVNLFSSLYINGNGSNLPNNTGNIQSSGLLQRLKSSSSLVLDFGLDYNTNVSWLQSTNSDDLSQNFPLNINPNGGVVNVYDSLNSNIIKSSDNLIGGNIISFLPNINLTYTGNGTYSNVKNINSTITVVNDGSDTQEYVTVNGYKSDILFTNNSSGTLNIGYIAGYRTGGFGVSDSSTGTCNINNIYSFYSQGHSYSGNGTATNSYGLYLSPSIGFVNNYGIYQEDTSATNVLMGSFQLGDDFKISKDGTTWTINAETPDGYTNTLKITTGVEAHITMGIEAGDFNNMYIGCVGGNSLVTYKSPNNYFESGHVGIGTLPNSIYTLDVLGDVNITGTLTATVKSFVINHPTKENKKLQYGVLEGPEHSVYIRGKLKNENIITLPDYWVNLIHEDTITVNLTPIGNKQDLFVKNINSSFIEIYGNENIECFYTVFAERKDVEKLITEF